MLVSRMSWPMLAAVRCYGRDRPYVDFGTVESKIGREGSGRYGYRRPTATVSTGNTDYFRTHSCLYPEGR